MLLTGGDEGVVVDNVALLVLQGSDPAQALTVLVPPDPVESFAPG
jgi:hypothetical protein